MTTIAPTLQAFFSDRLARQLHASPRTIASYRDTLRLLLCFAQQQTMTAPSALDWDQLDEPLIAAFLDHLESERGNSARTRNLRLTAIRSLFSYAALRHPEHAAVIARVLSIPPKRFDRRTVDAGEALGPVVLAHHHGAGPVLAIAERLPVERQPAELSTCALLDYRVVGREVVKRSLVGLVATRGTVAVMGLSRGSEGDCRKRECERRAGDHGPADGRVWHECLLRRVGLHSAMSSEMRAM
jgi:hypothetical protein